MKLFIVSAALVCFVCVVLGCNNSSLRSTSASLDAQGKAPQAEYSLNTDGKKQGPVKFSHENHTTKNYSVDGTKPIGCVECHHTERAAADAAKTSLKTSFPADRTVALTAETAKDAKTPEVQSCRACHAREGDKPKLVADIPEFTPEGESDPITLTAEEAFHRNCNSCHTAAFEKRKAKAPTACADCHAKK
jgi:hypothetical protein